MSEPTTGELRRMAARLAQLGILRGFVPDDEHRPSRYVATTVAGDVTTVRRGDAYAYLTGLAHGAHAARERTAAARRAYSSVDGAPVAARPRSGDARTDAELVVVPVAPADGRPLFIAPTTTT